MNPGKENLCESAESVDVKAEDLSVTTLVVLCGCSDGKLRAVAFEGKNAKQVHGYVRHIQGGTLQLKKEPVILVMDTPAIARAIAAADAPPLGRPPTLLQRARRFLHLDFPVPGLRSPVST
jgi:hypothetical protein